MEGRVVATDNLTQLVRWYEASEQASQDSRTEAEQARDYYDGKQLTESEVRALRKRKQPVQWNNLIKRKIDYLRGLERQSRTDPKAYPRTAVHEQDADAATDALRYVAADQNIDISRSQVFEHMLIEGFGGVEVTVARGPKGVIDPKVTVIAWDRIFFDPHSSKLDFSDARYLGFVTWMDVSAAKARWKDKAAIIEATENKSTSSNTETYDDKPRWANWYDAGRKRIRVVTMYYLDDSEQWARCEFTLSGHLSDPAPSPFIDEDGKPECGLILQAAYRDRDNDPYGIVRDMIPIQDGVNKRESKALHLLTMRQVRVGRSLAAQATTIRGELARPDGLIVADSGEVEVLNTQDMTAGHFQLLQEAKQNLSAMGPNATMQGKAGQDQSGRAILALQQGGMVEMAPLLDGLRHLTIRMYRQVWNRIRQYWTDERWVRVTDDNEVRFSALNTTKGTLAMRKLADAFKAGQIDEPTARQYEQQIRMDPAMMQPANVVAELDVDIDIDEAQDTPTLQVEQFQQITALAQSGTVPIPPEVIIEASTLRNKQKLLKMIEDGKKAQANNPAVQLQARAAEAKITKDEADATLTSAKAVTEQIDGAMKVGAAMQPQPAMVAA